MRPARRHSATRLASKNKENNQQDVVARNPLPPPASLCDRVLSTPSFLLLVLAIAVALVDSGTCICTCTCTCTCACACTTGTETPEKQPVTHSTPQPLHHYPHSVLLSSFPSIIYPSSYIIVRPPPPHSPSLAPSPYSCHPHLPTRLPQYIMKPNTPLPDS